ncbi:ly6/PLAUR domain-containing protein 6-like [Amphiura filiformis]|uniref:ly6/PLAUR domain-containing protein 6-like n=1 Tax=Amphiura filiformis TaxID=82378 RepID=UPI003B2244DC
MHCRSRDFLSQWLTLVVVLCTSYLADCVPAEAPIIFSYDNSTPFPNALKCFTCVDKNNNTHCNAKAYDAFCPEGTKYCHTSHYLNHTNGKSLVVNKKCAAKEECTPRTVGCKMQSPGVKRCVSCCEGSQCNFLVPTNESTAIFSTITPYNSGTRLQTPYNSVVVAIVFSVILVLANSRISLGS